MNLHLKILVFLILTASVSVIVSYVFVERTLKVTLENRIEAELVRTATNVVETIHSIDLTEEKAALDQIANRAGEATHSRVSILSSDGIILGDSHFSLGTLENLKNEHGRPEIQAAIASGKGIVQRFSPVTQQDSLFVAILDKHAPTSHSHGEELHEEELHGIENTGYIARISLSYEDVNNTITQQRLVFIIVGLVTLIFTVLMGSYGARILNRQIQQKYSSMEHKILQSTREMSLLNTLGKLLGTCTTLDEAGGVITKLLPTLLPGLSGAIYIIRPSRNQLYQLVSWGDNWDISEPYQPSECWALRKGHTHSSSQQGVHLSCPHMHMTPEQDYMCIPLMAQGDTLGVMHIIDFPESQHNSDNSLVLSISENIGLAIANLKLRDSLQQQAIKDPLTNLYNRRYLTEALEQSIQRSKRQNSPLALCILDFDNFKKLNDNFGHDAGDHVLKTIARVLKQETRSGDTVSRYGGEEFCLLFPDISRSEVEQLTQQLCEKVRNKELIYNQEELPSITISVGVAFYPRDGRTAQELFKQADDCLYIAKGQGKDQVVFSDKKHDS